MLSDYKDLQNMQAKWLRDCVNHLQDEKSRKLN